MWRDCLPGRWISSGVLQPVSCWSLFCRMYDTTSRQLIETNGTCVLIVKNTAKIHSLQALQTQKSSCTYFHTSCTPFSFFIPFLGVLAELRKTTIGSVLSVSPSVLPSVRMKQLGSHWTDSDEIWYFSCFRNSVEKMQILFNSDKVTGTWHEVVTIFLTISR